MNDDTQPSWQELLDLVTQLDEGNYDSVAVSFGSVSIRMSRSTDLELSSDPLRPPVTRVSAAVAPAPITMAEVASSSPLASTVSLGTVISAPMLGVFYRRPSPGSAPFVEVGQTVLADTTIGIIEIMKLMNPVVAGIAGVVTAFEVGDGESVQFGQALAHVDPAEK